MDGWMDGWMGGWIVSSNFLGRIFIKAWERFGDNETLTKYQNVFIYIRLFLIIILKYVVIFIVFVVVIIPIFQTRPTTDQPSNRPKDHPTNIRTGGIIGKLFTLQITYYR